MATSRLAEQFRSDAAEALRLVSGPGARWTFVLPDHRAATYRATSDGIERDEQSGGKPVRRETYVLGEGGSAKIIQQQNAKTPVATLCIEPGGKPGAGGINISATLGKDHRFSKPQ